MRKKDDEFYLWQIEFGFLVASGNIEFGFLAASIRHLEIWGQSKREVEKSTLEIDIWELFVWRQEWKPWLRWENVHVRAFRQDCQGKPQHTDGAPWAAWVGLERTPRAGLC